MQAMLIRSWRTALPQLALLLASSAFADFGEYESHALAGQALIVQTDIGELYITAVDDSAFEVHYRENDVRQLPSFAKAGPPPPVQATISETDATIEFSIDGLTAVVSKSPVRVSYLRNGEPLVAEEHGYYARETFRGFRFELDDGEKILGGGQRVLGMEPDIFAAIEPALTVYSGLAGTNPQLASPQVVNAISGLPAAQTNASGLSYTIYVEATTTAGIMSRVAATVALAPGSAGRPYQVLAWRQLQKSPFGSPSPDDALYAGTIEDIR